MGIKKKKPTRPFNPEGAGYDMQTALKRGIKPKGGHWPSLDVKTGMLLKGRKHKTIGKTIRVERQRGSKIIKRGKRYFSVSDKRP